MRQSQESTDHVDVSSKTNRFVDSFKDEPRGIVPLGRVPRCQRAMFGQDVQLGHGGTTMCFVFSFFANINYKKSKKKPKRKRKHLKKKRGQHLIFLPPNMEGSLPHLFQRPKGHRHPGVGFHQVPYPNPSLRIGPP